MEENIWRRKINGDADQPTDQQGEYSVIRLFEGWKIEGRDLHFLY